MNSTIYDFEAKTIRGTAQSLADYKGKVLLVVNVASQCGFTPQYTGLQKIYQQYKDRGFEILGFPCNQFGAQEKGSDAEIQQFCTLNFGVTFPMFSKIEVNGPDAHPLYEHLKSSAPGLLGTKVIKWNFTKFLVNQAGEVVKRFAPTDTPEAIQAEIEKWL
jgi:glutathione peroxidase